MKATTRNVIASAVIQTACVIIIGLFGTVLLAGFFGFLDHLFP